MVLIESTEKEAEILTKDEQNPSSSSSSPPSPQKPATEAKQVDAGDDSDGFQTASEREFSDEEHGSENDAVANHEEAQVEPAREGSNQEEEEAMEKANEARVEGDSLFVNGLYEEALWKYYTTSLNLVREFPEYTELRAMCYLNRGVCFLKLSKYEEAIKECTKALELNPTYAKALVRRAEAHEKLQHFEEAVADLKKILELDPSNDEARKGIQGIESLAAEKREKMKEEAITKLKQLGNSILGRLGMIVRFGMGVDNFKAV